ncbi:PhzF family phenazine biosynthesis protein [Clostridium botulinum]|nr:PhzF family phenazine biosynthesis protein [Clostridium botulinum]
MNIYQVNTFTNKVFLGNSIGVCLLNEPKEKHYMENVALELNLSETIFLCKKNDGYKANIFSPKGKLSLCVKPILAASHILWQEGVIDEKEQIKFYCDEYVLKANLNNEFIEITVPLNLEKKLCLLHNFSKALKLEQDLTIDYFKKLTQEKIFTKENTTFKIKLENENIILSGSAITVIVGDLII